MTAAKRRIMLVDDEENILITLGDFLAFQGFEVTACRTGREALNRLTEARPELILLDIMMPGMDGGDVAQRIAGDLRFAAVPIIYLTAAISKREVDARHGLTGGQPVLAKPVDTGELLDRIQHYLPPLAGEEEN